MSSPTLLVSKSKTLANLQRMMDRAGRHNVALRPHFKTHQSREVARWVYAAGIREIAVTSLRMAREYADGNWEGITIAMPLNINELPHINELATKVPLTVFVNHLPAATALLEHGHTSIRCYTELDTGYGRSGVNYQHQQELRELITLLGPERFRGFYAHSGHTYNATSQAAINTIHQELLVAIKHVQEMSFLPAGCEFVIGDTPACSTQEDFAGVTAIGPGNFIFYDLTQAALGSCSATDIAVCLKAPVLEVKPASSRIMLHAGWVQLGKDQLKDGTYGRLVKLNQEGEWNANEIIGTMIKLSQEHGTATVFPEWIASLKPGDYVGILPVHACAAVHGMRSVGLQKTTS